MAAPAHEEFNEENGSSPGRLSSSSTSDPSPSSPSPSLSSSSSVSDESASPLQEQGKEDDEDAGRKLADEETEELLEFVDRIKSNNTLREADLGVPQIVVVGKTSCGKSSLLEALTRLPFPVAREVCTRFATEIIMHRCKPEEQPYYLIQKYTHVLKKTETMYEHTDKNWTKVRLRLKEDLKQSFTDMEREWNEKVPPALQPEGFIGLRRDRLIVTVRRHGETQFSVVDLPGLVANACSADIALAQELATSHVKKEETYTLAVVDAREQFVNEAVLQLIKDCNALERTVAVLTKVDEAPAVEGQKIAQCLGGTSELRPGYGWFAIRNLNQEERHEGEYELKVRDQKEKDFFKSDFERKFKFTVNTDRTGIDNLKSCLATVLGKAVRDRFPKIVQDLTKLREGSQSERSKLPEYPDSEIKRQAHLREISNRYNMIALNLLNSGDVKRFGIHEDSLLWRNIKEQHSWLAQQVSERQKAIAFDSERNVTWRPSNVVAGGQGNAVGRTKNQGIYEEINKVWEESLGSEAQNDYPTNLKKDLCEKCSEHWKPHAESYVQAAIDHVVHCNNIILGKACSEKRLRHNLNLKLQERRKPCTQRASDELSAILDDLSRQPRTYNSEFEELHRRYAAKRKENLIEAERRETDSSKSVTTSQRHLQVFELHDWLQAYVHISASRFVDNVIIQVVERHLLGSKGPLSVFDEDFISNLSKEEMEDLFRESKKVKEERNNLDATIKALDVAIDEARRLMF